MDLMIRRRAMMARVESEPVGPIPTGYVKSGLLLWLDAICNTRNGHDANALYWEDLSGNQRDYAIGSSGLTFGQSSASFTTANHPAIITANGFTNEDRQQINDNTATIEIGVDLSGGDYRIVLPLGNKYGTINMYTNNGVKTLSFHPYNRDKSVYMLNGLHGYNSELWVDGVQQPSANFSTTWTVVNTDLLFSYSEAENAYSFLGDIAYLRLYNRRLTDAELTQNWRRDNARYNIT